MKSKQLFIGLALGLGLAFLVGFQQRGNEGSGEIAIVKVVPETLTEVHIKYYFPDGSTERESVSWEKRYQLNEDHVTDHIGPATVKALNKMTQLGYQLVSSNTNIRHQAEYVFLKE